MKKRSVTCLAAGVMCMVSTYLLCATASAQDKDQAELAKALQGVRITLEQGLFAVERSERTEHLGRPMSGKFEVEQGTLQLSVYMGQGSKFSEAIVDYKTGRVAKTEPITGGGDLAAAKAQSEAMAKARQSLRAATARAVKANPGFRAVSVTSALSGGRPVATITLLQGQTFKTVTEPLD